MTSTADHDDSKGSTMIHVAETIGYGHGDRIVQPTTTAREYAASTVARKVREYARRNRSDAYSTLTDDRLGNVRIVTRRFYSGGAACVDRLVITEVGA